MTRGRHYALFLRDILDACDECMSFVQGMAFEEFGRDRRTQLAVVKELEVIGEAANKLPPYIRRAAPEIPWQGITGMRNRLTHAYFQVNNETVWDTVHQHLPPLRQAVARLLNEYGG